ncbi:hypothetical protein A1D17_25290 [Pseudomonas fluorescens]|uniref:Uncharacterized protein n=1 Tax=Pseudomonas fluorescens TaxID=294 RepID=A0A166PTW5_PSEFL|nr:hypothetical protein A1D17_25290 [Pseudomonas fluorescens]
MIGVAIQLSFDLGPVYFMIARVHRPDLGYLAGKQKLRLFAKCMVGSSFVQAVLPTWEEGKGWPLLAQSV